MKKFISLILSALILLPLQNIFAANDPIGTTVLKDNMLYLDGYSIPAAQLPNEFVYVRVDDLSFYGFNVVHSEENGKEIYTVNRNESKDILPAQNVFLDEQKVYTTDAEVYIDSDTSANVFELENGDVLVQCDELAKYGSFDWNAETHQINIDFENGSLLEPWQPFHNVIGLNDINEIKYGVIVDASYGKCADIDYDDLKKWLEIYWSFNYDRVIAPLSAYELSEPYVKLWNDDKTKSYTVYSNSSVIVGKYGEPYESHGEIKQNYVWYLPVIGNSRSALNSANTELKFTYLRKVDEVEYKGEKQRSVVEGDKAEIPQENILITENASAWARPEIEKAAVCNLMIYDLSNNYVKPITRLEFCQLAYKLIVTEFKPNTDSRMGQGVAMNYILSEKGIERAYEDVFSDCSYTEVTTLAAIGIINGMGDGTFAPEDYITREQAATILNRTAEFLGNKTIPEHNLSSIYGDESAISDWAIKSVAAMKAMGIMHGVSESEFAPKEHYTVEQAIATMLRLYECN